MATVVFRKTSDHKKHKASKLLRRPIAPPPAPNPSVSSQKVPSKHSRSPLQTQCLPFSTSVSQEELSGLISPMPSFDSGTCIQDQLDRRYPAPQNTPRSPLKHSISKVRPSPADTHPADLKFIFESRYKLGSARPGTFDPKSLVKPIKTRGPDSFPLREPRRLPDIRHEFLYMDVDDPRYHESPEFTLEDFTRDARHVGPYPRSRLKETVLSKQNYEKMTMLFASFVDKPLQEQVHTLQLKGEDIPEVIPRVPQQQLLIEMAYIIRTQMRDMLHEEILSLMPSNVAPMVPYSSPDRQLVIATPKDWIQQTGKDQALFGVPPSKFFQGIRRSNSPFSEADSSATISPSELAILDCLVNGGLALSLKAHFIGVMPEMSPLVKTLSYLNLSFNDFAIIPQEVLKLKNLMVLKLRNNPLREIPEDISSLKKLRTLVVSFCLVSTLPLGLFQLPLEFLDVSYNKLTFLSNDIRQLKRLRALNIEGNQLAAMPSATLSLRNLRYLRVHNNYMHPLFWKGNSQNQPQRLTDLAALVFTQHELETRYELPADVSRLLQSNTTCDCCQGAVFGPGLRIIRPCSQAFGVKRLPFLFVCCSPHCRDWFLKSVESLTSILYKDGGDDGGGN